MAKLADIYAHFPPYGDGGKVYSSDNSYPKVRTATETIEIPQVFVPEGWYGEEELKHMLRQLYLYKETKDGKADQAK